jgi:dihydrofolate reductase
MTLSLLVAVARNGVIGLDGAIPWRLPADLKRVKATTMGHVLVMGRRTYESIGRPLPGRTTVVVTATPEWQPAGELPQSLLIATSLEEALALAGTIDDDIFIFGGARLYAEALPIAERLLVTWVDADPPGDTFFPTVEWSGWDEVHREPFDGGTWSTYHRRHGGMRPGMSG